MTGSLVEARLSDRFYFNSYMMAFLNALNLSTKILSLCFLYSPLKKVHQNEFTKNVCHRLIVLDRAYRYAQLFGHLFDLLTLSRYHKIHRILKADEAIKVHKSAVTG